MFQIDKDVPVPPRNNGSPRTSVWRHMAVGNSVFFPGRVQTGAQRQNGEKTISLGTAKRIAPGSRWTTRMVTENGVRGVRVWRIA